MDGASSCVVSHPAEKISAFLALVEVRDHDECWNWRGPKWPKGYGGFKGHRAHRFSWEIHRGVIPAGLMVLHKCDNPGCVNPNHLFVGTAQDNADDCKRKGRIVNKKLGTKQLTDDEVRAIRARYEVDKIGTQAIAAEFGRHTETIRRVVRRTRYARVE